MPKLDLEYNNLDKIFEIDFGKKIISLKPKEDGSLRTSINMQQLYNWHKHKLMENMWAGNTIEGSGFIGLQPVITFTKGLKIKIPNVPKFVVKGLIATSEAGQYPFIVEPETSLIMSQYARPHAKVFLRHSSKDKTFVRQLRESLYSICETFFDETDIHYGQSITARLDEELNNSDVLALILSKNSSESDWVRKEWASMLYLQKPVLVIRIDNEDVPPLLKDIKYISSYGNVDEACNGISVALGDIQI